jgi:hypothetical protein
MKHVNSKSELIIIDDCSTKEYKLINKKQCTEANYIELPKNIGRSKIRNLFLKYAKYENLLFLDCDSKITNKNFVKNYINSIIENNSQVIFGGSTYPEQKTDREHFLRWEYGTKKESKNYEYRTNLGNKAFLCNNFLINRFLFKKVQFDENLTKYGYEDTLFSHALNKENVVIHHIDNSVLNNEIDSNEQYLHKVSESIENLKIILTKLNYDRSFIEHITLLKTYHTLGSYNVKFLFKIFFSITKPFLKTLLLKGYYINLVVFNIYKLGLLTQALSTRDD